MSATPEAAEVGKRWWPLIAGLSTAAVVVPQAMAYAAVAGLRFRVPAGA